MSSSWGKDFLVHPNELGGSQAAIVLADLLNSNKIEVREKHRLMSFYTSTILECNEIFVIQSKGLLTKILSLWKQDKFAYIVKQGWDAKVKSFLQNIITYHVRTKLKTNIKNIF